MKTTKASNYLAHSGHDISEYHIQTADKIYSLIADGNLRELGEYINSIQEADRWYIQFAFFDKFGFGYEGKIQKMAKDYNELLKYGLTKKSPK